MTVDKVQTTISKINLGILVFCSRFIKIMPNFSVVGSFGFFQSNFLIFMIQIMAFDLLVSGLYSGFIFTYLGFAGYWLLGRLAKKSVKRQMLFLPIASFTFFLLSNFGVWWYWYPRSIIGLMSCYSLALPFYRNTLFGDLFFGGVFILSKKFVSKKIVNTHREYA